MPMQDRIQKLYKMISVFLPQIIIPIAVHETPATSSRRLKVFFFFSPQYFKVARKKKKTRDDSIWGQKNTDHFI